VNGARKVLVRGGAYYTLAWWSVSSEMYMERQCVVQKLRATDIGAWYKNCAQWILVHGTKTGHSGYCRVISLGRTQL
jgi:hypothetical protein